MPHEDAYVKWRKLRIELSKNSEELIGKTNIMTARQLQKHSDISLFAGEGDKRSEGTSPLISQAEERHYVTVSAWFLCSLFQLSCSSLELLHFGSYAPLHGGQGASYLVASSL